MAALPAFSRLHAGELPAGPLPVGTLQPVQPAGLENVFRLSEKLYTGSAPEGDEGFRSLQRLRVRTVLSVDGMPPDLERARRFGIRYVHLPFGYDGCPAPRAEEIVRAVRALPGPVYLHCHHGKHRGPTAAAFVRIALDGLTNAEALREMERAGVGKEYSGLYADVRAYRRPDGADLDRAPADFPETAKTPPLVEAMVRIEGRFARLTEAQHAAWRLPAGTPGSRPEHDALQLRELYRELNRRPELQARTAEFRARMRAAEEQGRVLEEALRRGDGDRASMALGKIAAGCGSCHAKYRDVPSSR